ncbi:MAG: response regulator [Myxococcaceae bacterium]|nr:response regulator [Myxococcaceae bacterium]
MAAPSESAPAVLYVDDELINLRVFEANFRSRFRIFTCLSGEEALELLAQKGQEIAVVISDQRMPGMTGVEFLERARAMLPDTRRMLLTAYSDMQAVMDAVNRGQVVRYFVKPWVKEELAAALDDAIGIFSLQNRVREIESRMLRSERLAVLGQVSAGVAHELMNPVSYLTQNIGTLRREVEVIRAWAMPRIDPSRDAEVMQSLGELPSILDDVETGAQHIRQVALAIRSQARGEDQEAQADLRDVAEFAVKLARAEVRTRARIQLRGDSLKVAVGPVKLCQVLLNLMVNSAQAMEGLARPGLIEVRWWRADERAHVEIADNGSGIAPEIMDRIFEPLFTTKPVGTGTGLGLPIVKDIVERAGGTLSVTSTVGVGTTFRLTLPLAAA